ncbi:MAG: glycine oxidase ThiO [Acidobacteriota bacterium]
MKTDSQKTFDAAIIGGGVIGCAIAWRLAQAGLSTAIIERGNPGAEASGAAGGMLAPLAEADRRDAFFDLSVDSRAHYPSLTTELFDATGVDIEYRTEGTVFLAFTDEDEAELETRFAWQQGADLNVERLDSISVRKLEPLVSEDVRWALRFPDDHQVNNRQLVVGLEAACRASGVTIMDHTEATSLVSEQGQIRGVQTRVGVVEAANVVIAAGSWSSLLAGSASTSAMAIEPVRGQMIALNSPHPAPRCVIYSKRAYLIPRLGGFLIAGSTTEHAGYEKVVTAGGLATILERAIEIMPMARSLAITETWAGLRPATADGLPVLGVDPAINGLFYATGHYRNGILLAPITAEIIRDLIVSGSTSRNLAPFEVTRFAHHSAAG